MKIEYRYKDTWLGKKVTVDISDFNSDDKDTVLEMLKNLGKDWL